MPLDVHVPASSANLGPGFDCLGLAVGLELRVRAEPADADRFSYEGEGSVSEDPDNLVHRGFRAAVAANGAAAIPVRLSARNPVPLARGLGSSSAALVAGALLGDAVSGGHLGRDGVFRLTADLEGHPDNVAPALFGGLTVSARDAGGWISRSLAWPAAWHLLFGVPDSELSTERARAVLPRTIDRAEAVATASRVAFWPLAVLLDEPELLRCASVDVTHEPYRRPLLPGFTEAQARLRDVGAWAAYLSGAGPTLAAVCGADRRDACRTVLAEYAGPKGRVLEPGIGRPAELKGRFDRAPASP